MEDQSDKIYGARNQTIRKPVVLYLNTVILKIILNMHEKFCVKLNNSEIKEDYIHMDDNSNSKYFDQSYKMNT